MAFSRQIRIKSLEIACRSLATTLEAGVAIPRAFELAGRKLSDPVCRGAFEAVVAEIRNGSDVASALRKQRVFPPLFVDMVEVGEQTGNLPEILLHLANHYENNIRLKRDFVQSVAWPVIQLNAAIWIIAMLIFLLGWIADMNKGQATDLLGLGLLGKKGAIIWLSMTYGTLAALYVGYRVATGTLQGRKFLDPLLMKIPVVGGCLRSFAVARFSWAYFLTQQSGMPVDASLAASLRSTGNGAYEAAIPYVKQQIRQGEVLGDTLRETRLFPADYIEMVGVAEETGTVPEELHRLSPQFEEQARRALKGLSAVAGWLVWATVATFIVFFIFRLMLGYIGMIEKAAKGIGV